MAQSGNPFRELLELHNRLSRLFQDENRELALDNPSLSGSWSPPADIFETPQALVITMELPGLNENDVQVAVEGGRLVIRGERPFMKAVRQDQVHRLERPYGSFQRVVALPEPIQVEAISAIQENGVLTITLPKDGNAGPRHVPVKRTT